MTRDMIADHHAHNKRAHSAPNLTSHTLTYSQPPLRAHFPSLLHVTRQEAVRTESARAGAAADAAHVPARSSRASGALQLLR